MTAYDRVETELTRDPRRWTVTGAAGFIGSHLIETLLALGQEVVGLDNFATGSQQNLDSCRSRVGEEAWAKMKFVEGDIRELDDCVRASEGSDYVLHQAALGSIPRSIANPALSAAVNVNGFVNVLIAARDTGIKRVVFASSSSVYGDSPDQPKVETSTGSPLSPYAVTKCANELFAGVFRRTFDMEIVGLRYFNVFGPRQDPNGAYAAVIPRWIETITRGEECTIFGDGTTSRDFSYVANIVQGNLLAATAPKEGVVGEVINLAAGGRTSLSELYTAIYEGVLAITGNRPEFTAKPTPLHNDFRTGDMKHSSADISKAEALLGYRPTHSMEEGLEKTISWYVAPV
jgi:UDP-N-acetylglucosamine 4-epimerase